MRILNEETAKFWWVGGLNNVGVRWE
jgi:hypothetical protein